MTSSSGDGGSSGAGGISAAGTLRLKLSEELQNLLAGVEPSAVPRDRHVVGSTRRGGTRRLGELVCVEHGLGSHGLRLYAASMV